MAKVSGGKEVGRVSIRVLPNATKFRQDLQLLLKRVEGSMSANLRVEADTRPAERTIRSLRREIERNEANLQVDANTLVATAQVARVARDRIVNLRVNVNQASLAKAASAIAALSGARLLTNTFQDIGRGLANIDKNLPKIALVATGIATLTAAALSSTAGLVSLAAGIAQIGALALVMPGMFAAAAVSTVALVVALKNAGTQLEPLKQSFLDLGATINDQFWARARDPIIEFVTATLPQLQDGFAATANSLGNYTAQLAASFQTAFGDGRLSGMFGYLAQSIDIAATGTGALASSIAILGTLGASYLPRLSQYFVRIGESFNAWLSAAEADGRLTAWVDRAIVALGQLGSVFASLGSILASIDDAMIAAGGGGLASFSAGLERVARIMEGPVFQTALTTILEGANAGFSALGDALGPIGDMLSTLAPALSSVLTIAGQALGGLLSDIASALQEPAFAEGLEKFFLGIQAGFAAIGPALPAVSRALGTLGVVVGDLAESLGGVLGAALEEAAPLLSLLAAEISPLIPLLGDALIESLRELGPAFVSIARDVLPELVTSIGELAPLLPGLAEFFAELLVQTGPVAQQLLETLLPAIVALSPALLAMLEGATPLLEMLPVAAQQLQLVAAVISTVLVAAFGIAQVAWTTFTALITGDWTNFAEKIESITTGMADTVRSVWSGWVDGLVQIFQGGVDQAVQVGTQLGTGLRQVFDGAGDWLVGAGRAIVQGLIDGISGMIDRARSAISGVMEAIAGFIPNSPAKEGPFSGKGWTGYRGRVIVDDLVAGMTATDGIARLRSAANTVASAADISVSGAGSNAGVAARSLSASMSLDGTPVQLWIEGRPFSGMIGEALGRQERATSLTQLAGKQVV